MVLSSHPPIGRYPAPPDEVAKDGPAAYPTPIKHRPATDYLLACKKRKWEKVGKLQQWNSGSGGIVQVEKGYEMVLEW
jgi:hypothetical protein